MAERARALPTGPAFWLTMLAASALGTNLGDFAVDGMGLARWSSFTVLAAICATAVLADRHTARQTEAFYWLAIIALRAAATNVADALTHEAGLGYLLPTTVLGTLALAAGTQTRATPAQPGSPLIDARYWTAMLLGGVFGTTAGDMAAHAIGLPVAALALTAVLLIVLAARARWAPTAMLAYWCAVLAERAAGTPLGDGLASRRGLALGLLAAMACTAAAFLAALLWRTWLHRRRATANPSRSPVPG